MSTGIYGIGISALQVAQLGLNTAGHNIANANTEGYNRQRIIQASNMANNTGSGYIGTGVHVSTVERIYSSFLAKQVASAQTSVSALETYGSLLDELNTLLADKDAGLEAAMEDLFAGINQVSADPSSLVARQTMVSNAQSLVSRFKILNSQVEEQYQGVNSQIQAHVDSINSYAQQIAKVNQQIMVAGGLAVHSPNDLYDQRDQIIAELNKLVGVQTNINENGTMNVFFGNGQQLVVGTSASTLVAVHSSEDYSRVTVGLVNAGGTQELPESLITGGALSGLLQYRSESLDAVASSLGQIAVSLAQVFNAQHGLGQDLLGRIAGETGFEADFFTLGNPTVMDNTNNPASAPTVTASYSAPALDADGTFYTTLTGSDYRLHYDGTNLTLTRLADNVSWSGADIAALNTAIETSTQGSQGFTLDPASFTPADAGSSYLIQPTRHAARDIEVNSVIAADVRQIAVAAPIFAQASSTNTGTAVITAGSVAPGYAAPASGSPVTLTYSGGSLSGFPTQLDPVTSLPIYSPPVTVSINGVETSYTDGTQPVPYANGASYSFDGISFTLSGTPQDGDDFTITRNSNGVSDNRNALLLGQFQTSKTMAGNTASFSTVYSQMVSRVGNKGGEVNTVLAAQQSVLNEAEEARNSLSGVNLDEEAVDLLKYQQSYQAAAKMLQIASELFASILAIR